MNLKAAQELTNTKLKEFGLDSKGWTFQWKGRAKNFFGQCSYRHKLIYLNPHLTMLRSQEEVLGTILHEIAHALVGPGKGHGSEWKRMAESIGCTRARARSSSVLSEANVMDPELASLYKKKQELKVMAWGSWQAAVELKKVRRQIRKYIRRNG